MEDKQYKVKNAVISGGFEMNTDRIDLSKVSHSNYTLEYNPDKFPALVIRLTNPSSCVLFFNTGKFVITGLPTLDSAEISVKKLHEFLSSITLYHQDPSKIGKISVSNPTFEFKNIVAVGNISKHQNVDLEMGLVLMNGAIYEPEVFPGLILSIRGESYGRAVFLIFKNGKAVCVGVNNVDALNQAFIDVRNMITRTKIDAPVLDIKVPSVSINDLLN